MRNTYIVGIGQTPVGEHWESSLTRLAVQALRAARSEVAVPIQALYVANALGGELANQSLLGSMIATAAGLSGVEAWRVEAAGASGGAALRQAYLAVASGAFDVIAVVGVEKVTDVLDATVESGLALGLDSDYEAAHGLTLTAGWALLQQRYMQTYDHTAAAFAPFPVNAHRNAVGNAAAQYPFAIKPEQVLRSPKIAAPIALLDSSTPADGAAAIIIAAEHVARQLDGPRVRIAGSSFATGPIGLHERPDLLWLTAVEQSTKQALKQARVSRDAVNVLEVSDQHGIVAALSLEASGFVERGAAPHMAAEGGMARDGVLPLATMGGCKARGDAVGALGVYQLVELTQQLRGTAGALQVAHARVVFGQCLGGLGAAAATHILIRED
jgi:acetyl-CoA C-acetyltransferase